MNDKKIKLYPENNEDNEIFENAILIIGSSVNNQIPKENVTLYAEGCKKNKRGKEIKVPQESSDEKK